MVSVDPAFRDLKRAVQQRGNRPGGNRVSLGRAIRDAMKAHGLSRRALAKKSDISEGAVRNALLYASIADEIGDDTLVARLTKDEVRAYAELEEDSRRDWLERGAAPARLRIRRLASPDIKTKTGVHDLLDTARRVMREIESRAEHSEFVRHGDRSDVAEALDGLSHSAAALSESFRGGSRAAVPVYGTVEHWPIHELILFFYRDAEPDEGFIEPGGHIKKDVRRSPEEMAKFFLDAVWKSVRDSCPEIEDIFKGKTKSLPPEAVKIGKHIIAEFLAEFDLN